VLEFPTEFMIFLVDCMLACDTLVPSVRTRTKTKPNGWVRTERLEWLQVGLWINAMFNI
jgi:hypothetical protein